VAVLHGGDGMTVVVEELSASVNGSFSLCCICDVFGVVL